MCHSTHMEHAHSAAEVITDCVCILALGVPMMCVCNMFNRLTQHKKLIMLRCVCLMMINHAVR